MKYYSQYRTHDLFELHQSLSGLSKSNRWVKLADHLPWDRIEKEYNKRLRNAHHGAGNKSARMVVGALIVKHVESLSDEKTIQVIQENPYMQYHLGMENRKYFREKHMDCFNHPLGRPPKEENDVHLEDKKRAIGERNEVEATFGTSKRVYRANNIRAKLDETADTWIGACFFAKNVMKFLRGLLRLIFEILGKSPSWGNYTTMRCVSCLFLPVIDKDTE